MAKHSNKHHAKDAPVSPNAPDGTGATATATPHDAFVAVGIMGVFVFGMTMFAGLGKGAGRVAVAVMLALLLVQAMTHVNPIVKWANAHPLTPGDQPFVVTPSGKSGSK